MISCFPIYINDYRKLGGIVCGRNCVLFIWMQPEHLTATSACSELAAGRIRIWPPYIMHISIEYGRSELIRYQHSEHSIALYYILFNCNGMEENDSVPETRDWNW